MARKGGGGKLARSEVVTVRLDPKLRFGAELAARKQRRTVSSFIEWAIVHALEVVTVRGGSGNDHGDSAKDAVDMVWDVDEADRFAKLALAYPDLLTHDEQVLWKLICENGALWYGHFDREDGRFTWRTDNEGRLNLERLREHWDTFNKVSHGEVPKDKLPSWVKEDLSAISDTPF